MVLPQQFGLYQDSRFPVSFQMDLRPEVTTRVDGTGCVAKLLQRGGGGAKFTGLQLCQKSRKEERCTRVFGRDQLRCSHKKKTTQYHFKLEEKTATNAPLLLFPFGLVVVRTNSLGERTQRVAPWESSPPSSSSSLRRRACWRLLCWWCCLAAPHFSIPVTWQVLDRSTLAGTAPPTSQASL